MFWFKSCPKCGTGDLYASRDHFGPYIACLQCGHYLAKAEEVVLRYLTGAGSLPEVAIRPGRHVPAGQSFAGVV